MSSARGENAAPATPGLARPMAVFGIQGPQWLTDPNRIKPSIVLMSRRGLGAAVVIFLAALKNVPNDLYEAAAIDGAFKWRRLRSITVPMISPAIFFQVIILTIAALQMFDKVLVLFGNPGSATYAGNARDQDGGGHRGGFDLRISDHLYRFQDWQPPPTMRRQTPFRRGPHAEIGDLGRRWTHHPKGESEAPPQPPEGQSGGASAYFFVDLSALLRGSDGVDRRGRRACAVRCLDREGTRARLGRRAGKRAAGGELQPGRQRA